MNLLTSEDLKGTASWLCLFCAKVFVGALVYFVMTSLGELSAFMPTSGAFSIYGTKFIDPAFGFALGWTYWFNRAMTIAGELTASTMITIVFSHP